MLFRVSELEHWRSSSQFGLFCTYFFDVVAPRHILTRNRVGSKKDRYDFFWTNPLTVTPIDVPSVVLILLYEYDSNFPRATA